PPPPFTARAFRGERSLVALRLRAPPFLFFVAIAAPPVEDQRRTIRGQMLRQSRSVRKSANRRSSLDRELSSAGHTTGLHAGAPGARPDGGGGGLATAPRAPP